MINIEDIWVFRMIALSNLESDLTNGLYSKLNAPANPLREEIGNNEIISERDRRNVSCFPGTVVNNFVPFYFSIKTPMLYNIYTGRGVPIKAQKDIVYLCTRMLDLANEDFQWCFTNGNAAKRITKYYTDLADIENIDWRSIKTDDFRIDNADGDEDRIRKKHSEFLVKDYVPGNKLRGIAVFDNKVKTEVDNLTKQLNLEIEIKIKKDFYF